jgi:hypothetical protein
MPERLLFDQWMQELKEREARLRGLWEMTPAQRVAAMRRGESFQSSQAARAWESGHGPQPGGPAAQRSVDEHSSRHPTPRSFNPARRAALASAATPIPLIQVSTGIRSRERELIVFRAFVPTGACR